MLISAAAVRVSGLPGRFAWSPASGVSLALLYVFGPGYAPLVALAGLSSMLWIHHLPFTPAVAAAALLSAGVYALAGTLLRRSAALGPAHTLGGTFRFVLAAIFAPMALAGGSVTLLMLEGTLSRLLYTQALFQFWISETLGNLVIAPTLIFLLQGAFQEMRARLSKTATQTIFRSHLSYAVGQVAALLVSLWVVFGLTPDYDTRVWYLLFLPLLWVIMDYGLPGATVAILVVCAGSYLAVPLFSYPPAEFEELQVFLLLMSLTGHVAGAAFTERWQAEHALRRRLKLEEKVTAISTRLTNLGHEQVDDEIYVAIQGIGELYRAEAGYLFLFSHGQPTVSRYYEWKSLSGKPDAASLANKSLDSFPWLQSRVLKGEITVIDRIGSLPTSAAAERRFFLENGLQSAMFVPVYIEKRLAGLLGFYTATHPEIWIEEDVRMLALLGEQFLGVLQRRQADELLRESNTKFRSVVLQSYDGILLIDDDARIIEWNRGLERITGLRRPDVLGRTIWEIQYQLTPTNKRGPLVMEKLNRMAAAYQTEGPAAWAHRLTEHTLERTDGEQRQVQTLVFQIRGGKPSMTGAIMRDVTETRQGEEALLRSQSRLAEAGRLAHLGHFEIDMPSGRMEWSEETYRIFGWPTTRPAPSLTDCAALLHPEDQHILVDRITHAVRVKQTFDFEYRLRTDSDGCKTLHTVGQPLINRAGDVVAVFGTVMDVTSMKQAEAALRESQERYKELADSISDVFFGLDNDQRITYWNRASEELTGIPADRALGKSLYEVLPRLKGTSIEQFALEALRTRQQQGFVMEYRIRTKKHYLEVNTYPSTNGLSVFLRDVTERQESETRLRQSEARYRTVVEDQTDMICRFTPDGTITFVNEAYCRAFARRKRDVVGKKYVRWNAQPEQKDWTGHYSSLGPDAGPTTQVCQTLLADGKLHWIQWTDRPIFSSPGKVVEYQSVGRDISESKHLEEELRYLSTHDALTGIYNRSFFEAEVARLQRSRMFPISLLMADVNSLKATNDSQGHPAGDELLKRAARVLSSSFRPEDIVARFGGDEFAVLLPGTDSSAALEVLNRVRTSLDVYNRGSGGARLSLSIGIATGEKGQSLLDVLSLADERMYTDKVRQKTGNLNPNRVP